MKKCMIGMLMILTTAMYSFGADMNSPKPPDTNAMMPSNTVEVVNISGLGNELKTITINQDQAVTWKNSTDKPITLTNDPSIAKDPNSVSAPPNAGDFNSGQIEPGKIYTHMFTMPGTYKYVWQDMERKGSIGTIIVRPITK